MVKDRFRVFVVNLKSCTYGCRFVVLSLFHSAAARARVSFFADVPTLDAFSAFGDSVDCYVVRDVDNEDCVRE